MEEPAVALNVAVVAPARTVTDPGTVSKALLLPSVTLEPPVGAAVLKVTVQLEAPLSFRFPGVHVTDETVGTVMVPLVPDTVSWEPFASTPTRFAKVTAVVTALDPSVSETVATTPVAIVVSDPAVAVPASTHVTGGLENEVHENVLLAAVAAAPGVRLLSVYWLEGKLRVHSKPAGAVPEAVRDRLRVAVPPGPLVAEDKAKPVL
jgi:hypothetical protein